MIGQAPSRTGDPSRPCAGRSFERFARAAGAESRREVLAFFAHFERTNVLDVYPGGDGKGDAFPLREARAAADAMRPGLDGRAVVLVGKATARAFRIRGPECFDWLTEEPAPGSCAVVVPHPSGVNRWWNETENRDRARRFFRVLYDELRERRDGARRRARSSERPGG